MPLGMENEMNQKKEKLYPKDTQWKVSGKRFVKDGSEQSLSVTILASSKTLATLRAHEFLHKIEKAKRITNGNKSKGK